PLSEHVGRIVGIDVDRVAVDAAARNARAHGLSNVAFRHGKAHQAIRQLLKRGPRTAQLVVLHGMRQPFGPRVCKLLPTLTAAHVLIVAPTAMSLARDAATLGGLGYVLRQFQLVHHMPGTYHAMGVALLSRR